MGVKKFYLGPESQLMAQKVPSPRAELRYCGNFACNSFKPVSNTSPAWRVFSNKSSCLIVFRTLLSSISLPKIWKSSFVAYLLYSELFSYETCRPLSRKVVKQTTVFVIVNNKTLIFSHKKLVFTILAMFFFFVISPLF